MSIHRLCELHVLKRFFCRFVYRVDILRWVQIKVALNANMSDFESLPTCLRFSQMPICELRQWWPVRGRMRSRKCVSRALHFPSPQWGFIAHVWSHQSHRGICFTTDLGSHLHAHSHLSSCAGFYSADDLHPNHSGAALMCQTVHS